jgi:hypothetical protein
LNLNQERAMKSCLLWPVTLPFRLIAIVIGLVGRLALLLGGLAMIAVGVMVTFTVIGACVGIPLIILGVFLVIRGLF